jgi:LPS sulfotransferase NodH
MPDLKSSYLVCATPRSGSTLVCQALKETGVAGRPEEYFEALRHSGRPRRPEEYFEGVDDRSLLDHLGELDRGERILRAVIDTIVTDGIRTRDLGGTASTEEFGRAVARRAA